MAGSIVLLDLKNGIKINWTFSNARLLELELRRLLIIFVGQLIKISLSLKGRNPNVPGTSVNIFRLYKRYQNLNYAPYFIAGNLGWPHSIRISHDMSKYN